MRGPLPGGTEGGGPWAGAPSPCGAPDAEDEEEEEERSASSTAALRLQFAVQDCDETMTVYGRLDSEFAFLLQLSTYDSFYGPMPKFVWRNARHWPAADAGEPPPPAGRTPLLSL